MENSSVAENVKLLMNEFSVLMRMSIEGGDDENDSWSKIVKGSELEVENIGQKYWKLRKGPNPKNMIAEHELNTEVTQVLKYVKCLQECANVQRLQREQESDKPKMYSSRYLESFTDDFSIQIGEGANAKVYKGQFPDGIEIAVKLLNENKDVLDIFLAELSTMGRTSHQYLVKLYGYCLEERKKALVYEYMENGSFDRILYGNPHGLDWKKFYEIAVKIAEGLSYLHYGCPETIIHHDLKPANVLIDSNLSPKISDFGLAKFMNQCLTHLTNTGLKGTPIFVAPEMVYPGFEVNEKSDVYSFGMMLFEVLGMKRLDRKKKEWFPKQVYEKLKAGKLDEVLNACSISHKHSEDAKVFSMVALMCVQFKPSARPSMIQVVSMLKKKITMLSPRNPFQHFEESPVQTILEEAVSEFSPSGYGESSHEEISLQKEGTSVNKEFSSSLVSEPTPKFYLSTDINWDDEKSGDEILITEGKERVMKLMVKVIKGRKLRAMDLNGLSDPYVRVQVGKQRFKTKVVKKSLNPSWGEDFCFTVDDLNVDLVVSVLDKNRYFKDDFVGYLKLPITSLRFPQQTTCWYTLLPKNSKSKTKDRGEIRLTVFLF